MPKLTIYFTSDTHGYLYPTNFADRQPRPMGLLAMRFPKDENTLVIDGGDTIQGSPLTWYCAQNGVDPLVAQAMNERGYDYVTLGNHDFNNGRESLRDYLTKLDARCLCANVTDARGELPIGRAEVCTLGNGLRVGLVGIVTDWVVRWERPENLEDIAVSGPLAAAREAMRGLRADVWVGIYHGGVERDLDTGKPLTHTDENIACRLCEELKFDLLLTGHQHIAMANRSWRGTHIAQTPCNATAYVKVTLEDDGFHSELCPVPDHAGCTEAQRALRDRVDAWLDRPIGKLSRAIWPGEKLDMALHGSAIADFFNRVQLWASGADISCTALGNEVHGFDSEVTVRDVMTSYVYSNTLVVLRVTGAQLKEALEQCARYFAVGADGSLRVADSFLHPKEAHYDFDYFSGIEYTFDLSRPEGDRVARLTRGGAPVQPGDALELCMCNYRATGAGNFDVYRDCPHVREYQTEVSELIVDYLCQHPLVEIPGAHPCRAVFGVRML